MTNPPQVKRIKHLANIGDQIASLASLKRYSEASGCKIIYMQMVNVLAAYYSGATHPTLDGDNRMVTCNQKMFDMMRPLMLAQDYIEDYQVYQGQPIDLDLDVIRGKLFVNMPHGMLPAWPMLAYPDLAADITKPWITLPEPPDDRIKNEVSGKVIINFTERYRNNMIDYFFLKNYQPDLIFAGTEREHILFTNAWGVDIPRLNVENFLELAYALKYCKFFMGNQSFCWGICDAMKLPRILEMCSFADNCQPFIGEDSYGFYHQVGVEFYFRTLYNKR